MAVPSTWSVCQSWFGMVVISWNASAALITATAGLRSLTILDLRKLTEYLRQKEVAMQFLTLAPRSTRNGKAALTSGTRKDLGLIDEALASEEKRALAEVALHIAARMLEREPEIPEEEAPLSKEEQDSLARFGINAADTMADTDFYRSDPVVDGMTREAILRADAIPLAEAARRMGVSDARLRQRISAGSLIAVPRPHGRGWLIPAFQLTDDGEVPHLGRVLLATGRPVSAQAMDRFFRTPREDLHGSSPRDWLVAGHDPAIIESILSGL